MWANVSAPNTLDRAWIPIIAVIAFLVLTLDAARLETPTVDEFAHLPAGVAHLAHGRLDVYEKNPPLFRALLAAPVLAAGAYAPPVTASVTDGWTPWRYGAQFMAANRARYFDWFLIARTMVVLTALGAALVVWRWSRELFGADAAGITTALFLLCPPVLAHGHLATIDIAAAASIAATLYAVHWTYRQPSTARLATIGLALGVALLVKFTATLIVAVIVVLALVRRWPRVRRGALDAVLIGAVAVLVVNAGLGFHGSFTALDDYAFQSRFLAFIAAGLPGWLPVPLPSSYVTGWDLQKVDIELGEFGSYLLGSWEQRGFVSYNLVALAAKIPLPTLALLGLGMLGLRRALVTPAERLGLVLPIAVLLVVFTLINTLDLGIRYLLPLLPLLFVAAATLWAAPSHPGWIWAGRSACAIALATALWVHPAHLGHFSILFGGEANGHRVLADSNLDWGQDLYRLPAAVADLGGASAPISLLYFGHVDPGLYGIEFTPTPRVPVQGIVAASANFILGASYVAPTADGNLLRVDGEHLAWLREREPTARAGSIWLYDLRGE